MSMSNQTEELCGICHRPQAEHKNYQHAFVGNNQPKTLVARSQQSPDAHEGNQQGAQGALPKQSSDAILRLALLRKGLITTQDLDDIEEELRVTGVAFHDPHTVRSTGHS